jgi:hypothetical protein
VSFQIIKIYFCCLLTFFLNYCKNVMVPLENRELYHERGAGQHHPLLRHHDQEGLHSQGGIKENQRGIPYVVFVLQILRGWQVFIDPL